MTIEVEEKTADVLEKLRAQAAAKHVSFAAYLETFLEATDPRSPSGEISLEEFDAVLDALSADLPGHFPLPADFSRADVYLDHN